MARRSLKTAPRRDVRHIKRHGDWGEVEYHHHLACGHVEVRKRRTPHAVIACSGCLTAQEFAAGRLPDRPTRPVADGPVVDDMAGVETQAGRLRAGLANRFGVDAEAIDVALRGAEVGYVLVFLDRETALRLAGEP